MYLQGLETFDLALDHEPLKVIYSTWSKPSARIERWGRQVEREYSKHSLEVDQESVLEPLYQQHSRNLLRWCNVLR